MKIGITERGDPVFHYAELNKKQQEKRFRYRKGRNSQILH